MPRLLVGEVTIGHRVPTRDELEGFLKRRLAEACARDDDAMVAEVLEKLNDLDGALAFIRAKVVDQAFQRALAQHGEALKLLEDM